MAAAMFVLLFTAFLPIAGVQFAWVTWHWMAGLVLTGVDPLSHHPRDVVAGLLVDLGRAEGHSRAEGRAAARAGTRRAGPKPGKYPLGNRLYHLAIVAGRAVGRRDAASS